MSVSGAGFTMVIAGDVAGKPESALGAAASSLDRQRTSDHRSDPDIQGRARKTFISAALTYNRHVSRSAKMLRESLIR